tara:strand:- start:188 stop:400 length:213 start_codon:yes stop_codon:yes gene_type:complete
MTLSDEVIGQIAKVVQIAILTGTDVVDNLRMMRLSEEDGQLFLDKDYVAVANQQIESMLEEAMSSMGEEG